MLPVASTSVWEPYLPDTLVDICIKVSLKNRSHLCCFDDATAEFNLCDGITLPAEICERMLYLYSEELYKVIDDKFLNLFKDPTTSRLSRVNLHDSAVTDEGIALITKHPIVELDISNCSKLTQNTLEKLNDLKSDLISLTVGSAVQIFPETLQPTADDQSSGCNYEERGYILRAPNLRKLVIKGLSATVERDYFPLLLRSLTHLTHLDLSMCYNLGDLKYLLPLKQIVYLSLFDVPRLQDAIENIVQLSNLRHLDISQSNEKYGHYKHPNTVLRQIVINLPHLVSLDISGTNLAGNGIQERNSPHDSSSPLKELGESVFPNSQESRLTDIPGLKNRVDRPLEFLGLLNTPHEACYRHHIPALRIAGDANEQQIMTAAQMYYDRPPLLQKVLNDLFHLFRYESCCNPKMALDVVLVAMRRHLGEKHVQIAGSASLFYIVKSDEKNHFTIKMKKIIIKTLLDAMCMHRYDTTMLRNGCLTLIHFKIPQDVLFDYVRLVDILLYVVSQDDQDDFVQRIGIYLINSLACQVDGIQKQLVGKKGAVTVMLQLIAARMNRHLCDEVMETAWSTMWNVTDETPINCKLFLDERGMELFLGCLRMFPDKPELLRNMMGLLGNVAEVKELRPFLMKDEYLSVFCDLLDSTSDGIEVSYNAAGILSHIASDGPEIWGQYNIKAVRREEVLSRMVSAIERWDLSEKRNINYRSFEPILRLLSKDHTPEVQHWSIWALANLTKVYADKYCVLLKDEGGLEIIEQMLQKTNLCVTIKRLAMMTFEQCKNFLSNGDRVEDIDIQ